MTTLKDIESKLTEAGLSEMYPIILNQALNQIALTDKTFYNILADKIMYTLKAEVSKIDSDFVLKAVLAHEAYVLYLKTNKADIISTIIEMITE